MTEQVIISIKGLQFTEEDTAEEPVEVVTPGKYYFKNGIHYLKYDEIFEGIPGITKNLIKIQPHMIEVHKKGAANVHMVFEENKKTLTYYHTPYGSIQMGIASTKLGIEETADQLDMKVDYALEMNYEHVADCTIVIHAQSKDGVGFHLQG